MINNEYFNADELKFKLRILSPTGKTIEVDPLAQVIIDENRIKDQIKLLPAQYAFFTAVYLEAKTKKDVTELELNSLKAQKSKEIRIKYKKMKISGGEKGLSNKEVEEYLFEDVDVIKKEREFLSMTLYSNQCYFLVQAIDKKQAALASLSYMQNQEMKVTQNIMKDNLLNSDISIDANLFEKTKPKEKE